MYKSLGLAVTKWNPGHCNSVRLFRKRYCKYSTKFSGASLCQYDKKMFSRFSASTILSGSDVFTFNDYDCIGFDLDNTICNYNLKNKIHLIYEVLSKYLVEEKGYNAKYVLRPLDEAHDFLLKGLLMDFAKGNILRVGVDGYILKASHGTKLLTNQEIDNIYGPERKWDFIDQYVDNLLVAWNSPLTKIFKSSLDYFDMSAVLCFAHCVDSLDHGGKHLSTYNVWPDIMDGVEYMYSQENFANGTGGFFPAVKSNPSKYIRKCDESVISWIKTLKREKKTFLITASGCDFASFTAKTCIGDDWMELFDVIVFGSRKPAFFLDNQSFVGLSDGKETGPIKLQHNTGPHVYCQGNAKELVGLLSYLSAQSSPKIVYIGDNLLQDVYTPSTIGWDTIALVEEITAEGVKGADQDHPDSHLLCSKLWGSYFSLLDCCDRKVPSLWNEVIRRHAKICVPSLRAMSCFPIDHEYLTFSDNEYSTGGYHPGEPVNSAK